MLNDLWLRLTFNQDEMEIKKRFSRFLYVVPNLICRHLYDTFTYASNDKDWDWEISLGIYHDDPQST